MLWLRSINKPYTGLFHPSSPLIHPLRNLLHPSSPSIWLLWFGHPFDCCDSGSFIHPLICCIIHPFYQYQYPCSYHPFYQYQYPCSYFLLVIKLLKFYLLWLRSINTPYTGLFHPSSPLIHPLWNLLHPSSPSIWLLWFGFIYSSTDLLHHPSILPVPVSMFLFSFSY